MDDLDLLDDIFAEAVEEIKHDSVAVTSENKSWTHILYINDSKTSFSYFTPSAVNTKRSYSIIHANKIVRILKHFCDVSDLYPGTEYAYKEDEHDKTYTMIKMPRSAEDTSMLVGFNVVCRPSFMFLYYFGRYVESIRDNVTVTLNQIDNFKFTDFTEKICCKFLNISNEEFFICLYAALEREIRYARYNLKLINKIMNLSTFSSYYQLNCFDVFEECHLKKFSEESPKSIIYDELPNKDDFFWDGTPKMNNIKVEQKANVHLWIADMNDMRNIDSPNSREFVPKLFKLPAISNKKIVKSEIILYNNKVTAILELEHEKISGDVLIKWLTVDFDSSETMRTIINELIAEEDADQIAEIIRREVYFITKNEKYAG